MWTCQNIVVLKKHLSQL